MREDTTGCIQTRDPRDQITSQMAHALIHLKGSDQRGGGDIEYLNGNRKKKSLLPEAPQQ